MGAELYATDPAYRAAFDECAALAGPVGGGSLVDSVFGRPMDESDGYDDLEATNLVLLAQGYALAQCLLARGLRPAALAGYSLGEFTAAVVAGALDLGQTLGVLRAHSRHVMRQAPQAAMVAVLGSPALWLEHPELAELAEIGCINSPRHFVVTTSLARFDALVDRLGRLDVSWARLPVRYGFHGALLDLAEPGYAAHVAQLRFREPAYPIYSSLLAGRVHQYDALYFWRTARGLLRFRDLVVNLWAAEPRIFVDCSPTGTLAAFVRQILGPSVPAFAAMNRFGRNLDTLAQLETALSPEVRR